MKSPPKKASPPVLNSYGLTKDSSKSFPLHQPKKKRSGPKPGRGKSKGNAFERDLCKQLSLWHSDNKDDNVFYRTPNSGGRATVRGKQGKDSHGQSDIQCTGKEATEFIEHVIIEAKCGYNFALHDAVFEGNAEFYRWLSTASSAAKAKKRPASWWLVWKQDRKSTLLLMPTNLFTLLKEESNILRDAPRLNFKRLDWNVTVLNFQWFISNVHPSAVSQYLRRYTK